VSGPDDLWARVAELEAERDRFAAEAESAHNAKRGWIKMYERENERVRVQEEQIAALQEALREIAETPVPSSGWSVVAVHAGMVAVAREALALAEGCAAPADEEKCPNRLCSRGLVAFSNNESNGAPAIDCRHPECPYRASAPAEKETR